LTTQGDRPEFDVDITKAAHRKNLPQSYYGGLSKLEQENLVTKAVKKKREKTENFEI